MKWTKCAIRFLRISRPGVRVPSIAPQQQNPNFFPIGEGFGFFVFFGKQNESLESNESVLDLIIKSTTDYCESAIRQKGHEHKVKEKYRPCSAAMILPGEVSGKMNRVCCGTVKCQKSYCFVRMEDCAAFVWKKVLFYAAVPVCGILRSFFCV